MIFKTLITVFVFLFTAGTSLENAHEFHLSNSELKYKSSTNELQLSIKIFIDDLESALAERGIEGLRIGTERESEESVMHVGDYLSDTFIITASETQLSAQILGTELSEDLSALWCYVRFPIENDCSKIQVTNTLLTEIFDDQKNIVSFKTESGNKQYFTFDGGDKEKVFSCE